MSALAVSLEDSPAPRLAAVAGKLNFIVPRPGVKPAFKSAALAGGVPEILFDTDEHEVPVADMRPVADTLSVDREGFELLRRPTAVADLYDDNAVRDVYYPEIESLLRDRFNADRVVVFDATRRADSKAGAANPDGQRGPATRVHVDYTTKSGPRRLTDLIGHAEVARLLQTGARVIQINVWRPIKGPVRRSPLALADASSVVPEDLVETDQLFPDRIGEIYHLAHAPTQRWYYAPEMTADEVLLIKGWDSLIDGTARYTPHSAFDLPGQDPSAPPRESIEVRTFVIIENRSA